MFYCIVLTVLLFVFPCLNGGTKGASRTLIPRSVQNISKTPQHLIFPIIGSKQPIVAIKHSTADHSTAIVALQYVIVASMLAFSNAIVATIVLIKQIVACYTVLYCFYSSPVPVLYPLHIIQYY